MKTPAVQDNRIQDPGKELEEGKRENRSLMGKLNEFNVPLNNSNNNAGGRAPGMPSSYQNVQQRGTAVQGNVC